ncbi:MAG: hypothetical protein CL897_02735 [Dehalococcoidia bacterium]|mgnify:CR=1 FL=1|nr:hypothetical protein [Dehalococcoidia bacterium]|tara:strand:- start:36 stop:665 length:630 start_codon:yes stop_codon:yes gene_type:complete
MTLILVRHGESQGNIRGLMQGQLDMPLTDAGREQAAFVAERLKFEGGAQRIVASPLVRAYATAEVAGKVLGLSVSGDKRLMEYDFGEASGLTVSEVLERYPGWSWLSDEVKSEGHFYIPGEEGWSAFQERVFGAVTELVGLDGQTIAVTHGGVVMAALNAVMRTHGKSAPGSRRVPFPMKNCSITELGRDEKGRLVLQRHNDYCHLPVA